MAVFFINFTSVPKISNHIQHQLIMKNSRLLFLSILLILIAGSCSDLKKGEQLKAIDAMNTTLDSINTVLIENEIDTLPALITATIGVELRIKNNYYSDTIDMELGKKMDAFKRMRKMLGPLNNTFITLRTGTKEEKEILQKLKMDIENGNGDRKKYPEYVSFEQNKVDQLRKLLNEYVEGKNKTFENFDEIYNEMNEFSLKLLDKNKKEE